MAVLGAVSTSTNCPIHICSIVSENRCGCCFAANVTRKKKNQRNETRVSHEIIKGGKSEGK